MRWALPRTGLMLLRAAFVRLVLTPRHKDLLSRILDPDSFVALLDHPIFLMRGNKNLFTLYLQEWSLRER